MFAARDHRSLHLFVAASEGPKKRVLPMALLCVFICYGPVLLGAESQVIYDTLGANGGFDFSHGYFISLNQPEGARFVVPNASAFTFDGLDLAVETSYWGGNPGLTDIQITVRTNSSSNLPDAIIDMMELHGIKRDPHTLADGTYSLVSSTHPQLNPNTPYWIVVSNISTNTSKPFWYANSNNVHDPVVEYRTSTNSWYRYEPASATSPAVRIHASSVPEPGTLALLLVGGVLLLLMRRYHKWTRNVR
jgi:hypothetical protein